MRDALKYDKIQIIPYKWTFIFLSANIDAVETAERFGISADRAQNFHADRADEELNFRVMSEAVATYREGSTMPKGWNKEIQKTLSVAVAKNKMKPRC